MNTDTIISLLKTSSKETIRWTDILIGNHTFSSKKKHLKMSSGKWRQICLVPNVLIHRRIFLNVSCYPTLLTRSPSSYISYPPPPGWNCHHTQFPSVRHVALRYDHRYRSTRLSAEILEKLRICFYPDSKFHGCDKGPTWGRQDPGGPHVGSMNLAILVDTCVTLSACVVDQCCIG